MDIASVEKRMDSALNACSRSLGRIRTGRASPALLDAVLVDYYGTETPINQVANIVVESARVLAVIPWEKGMVEAIEKALMASDLGITPSSQGDTIRLALPDLTEETRREYVRRAKTEAENGRVVVRNIRRDTNNTIRQLTKDKEDGMDQNEENTLLKKVQDLTDQHIEKINDLVDAKEQELLVI